MYKRQIPEAFEAGKPHQVAAAILAGIFGFFVLEKLLLWRHCHTENCEVHDAHDHGRSGALIVVGDETYRRGTRHGISFPRQALHATELALVHPATRQAVSWRAPLPRDMKRLVDSLRNDQS